MPDTFQKPVNRDNSVGICIMVEPGNLEWQFVILVSSILSHCYDDYEIYAYCREELIKKLRPETISFAERWKVQIAPLKNPFKDGYPQGNKIAACAMIRPERWTVFLDTDTGLLRPTRFADAGRDGCVGMVPARKRTWTRDIDDWDNLFQRFGLKMTNQRVQLGLGGLWVPYANGGFVIYDNKEFGKIWLETALSIDDLAGFPSFRPWLDQVSLTIAAYRNGIPLDILDMIWNDTPLLWSKNTKLIHYHKVAWMNKFGINTILREAVSDKSDYPNIGELLRAYRSDVSAE